MAKFAQVGYGRNGRGVGKSGIGYTYVVNDNVEIAIKIGADGVHVGHQTLIAKAVEKAHELGIHSAVFTFSNHPKNLFEAANIIFKTSLGKL